MPNEPTELGFSLEDVVGGQPLTPATVDLPTLRGFLEEVETLIKGDMVGASLADSRVRIETGSVRVVALVAYLLAADVRDDLAKLDQTADLDAIQPKRAQVIDKWQSRSRRSPSRVYSMAGAQFAHAIRITSSTRFEHRLIQFLPQTTDVDEQALLSLWAKGRKAWKDVKSAASWVEGLRGNG